MGQSRALIVGLLGASLLLSATALASVPGLPVNVPSPEEVRQSTAKPLRPSDVVPTVSDAAYGGRSSVAPPVAVEPVIPSNPWTLGDLDYAMVALAGAGALGLLGVGLYMGTRYVTREDVLRNDVRGRIYAHIKARTGVNLKQLTDDLQLTTTNAIWHLRKLEDAGLVHSRRFNGYKVFYPAEGGVEARRMSLSLTALQNGNAQEIFELVVSQPGAHQREIARALNVNHGTVRWHLKKLCRAELLTELRQGKVSTYTPTPLGLAALKRILEQQASPPPVPVVIGQAAGA